MQEVVGNRLMDYGIADRVVVYADSAKYGTVRIKHIIPLTLSNGFVYGENIIQNGTVVSKRDKFGTISHTSPEQVPNHLHFSIGASRTPNGSPTIPISPY